MKFQLFFMSLVLPVLYGMASESNEQIIVTKKTNSSLVITLQNGIYITKGQDVYKRADFSIQWASLNSYTPKLNLYNDDGSLAMAPILKFQKVLPKSLVTILPEDWITSANLEMQTSSQEAFNTVKKAIENLFQDVEVAKPGLFRRAWNWFSWKKILALFGVATVGGTVAYFKNR